MLSNPVHQVADARIGYAASVFGNVLHTVEKLFLGIDVSPVSIAGGRFCRGIDLGLDDFFLFLF